MLHFYSTGHLNHSFVRCLSWKFLQSKPLPPPDSVITVISKRQHEKKKTLKQLKFEQKLWSFPWFRFLCAAEYTVWHHCLYGDNDSTAARGNENLVEVDGCSESTICSVWSKQLRFDWTWLCLYRLCKSLDLWLSAVGYIHSRRYSDDHNIWKKQVLWCPRG